MLLKAREIQEKYKIAHNSLIEWENKKVLTSHRTVGGHRRWLEDDIQKLLTIHEAKEEKRYATYSRCSTAKQKENLERQVERLRKHCKDKGYENVKEYSEIGSGLNDNRPKLHKLIDAVLKREVNHIVVELQGPARQIRFQIPDAVLQGIGLHGGVLGREGYQGRQRRTGTGRVEPVHLFFSQVVRQERWATQRQQEQEEIG